MIDVEFDSAFPLVQPCTSSNTITDSIILHGITQYSHLHRVATDKIVMVRKIVMTTILMINLSVCLSRYSMPKDKDSGRDNNNYYYYIMMMFHELLWKSMMIRLHVCGSMHENDEIYINSDN